MKSKNQLDILIFDYIKNEKNWINLINDNFPNPRKYFGWQKFHRVILHEKQIIKIQSIGSKSYIPKEANVTEEYQSIKAVDKKLFTYEPNLVNLKKDWVALKINFFNGIILEDILNEKGTFKSLTFPILKCVIKLSMCGIYHPQLRARHFVVNAQKKICLIDFGNCKNCTILDALIKNFGIFKIKHSKLFYLIYRLFNKKLNKKIIEKHYKIIPYSYYNLKQSSDDRISFITKLVKKIFDNNTINSKKVYKKIPTFYLGNLYVTGYWQWEPLRRFLFKKIIFNNKKILILGSGIGLLPIFALYKGTQIVAYEEDKKLRSIANSILKLTPFSMRIIKEPKNLFLDNTKYDTVICFDYYYERDLLSLLGEREFFKDLFYISYKSFNSPDLKNKSYKFELLYEYDLNVYHIK